MVYAKKCKNQNIQLSEFLFKNPSFLTNIDLLLFLPSHYSLTSPLLPQAVSGKH